MLFHTNSAAYIALNHIYELGISSLRHKQPTNAKATAIIVNIGSTNIVQGHF